MKAYFLRLLIAFDQLIQAALRSGLPGQTISSRAGMARRRGKRWGCWLCGILDWIQLNHCEGAIANDIKRARAVITELRRR